MDQEKNKISPEIWGGAEYSFVRTGDEVYDQLNATGHESDSGTDLHLYKELGINTIRYPLLWEKYSANEKQFFLLHDQRLNKLTSLGIMPVAGLLHHGSGPFFTNLASNDFPELLAEYAYKIAKRYPWIQLYTPVNEPLTTARFSGLYGIWYPHLNSDRSFVRIFINELKAIVLSMQAIRSVNSAAGLVQTEDLCRVLSTTVLDYQAVFENLRRWLTYDLLLGKVTHEHPMYRYFIDNGIDEEELSFFNKNYIIPEVVGFNYYVTSERFLDHRKSIYPACFHGENMFHEYADVEAVRANVNEETGSYNLLKTAWERYKLPMALTEVHLSCTREEQLRWFMEAWETGRKLRSEGVDFRAITAWAFFGSYDWSSLLCQKRLDYESGVYDIRSGTPRRTAVAELISNLSTDQKKFDNILLTPGWWKRNTRVIYKDGDEELKIHDGEYNPDLIQPILITGSGSLGKAIGRVCETRGLKYILAGRKDIDIASTESAINYIESVNPWAIINAAGFTKIDDAENDAATCFRENTVGPGILAEICRTRQIKLVTFSSDQVFNGKKRQPYEEYDCTNPLNFYGLTKLLAEQKVLKINPDALIIRSSFFINPWNSEDSLAGLILSGMTSSRKYYLPSDIIISPSYLPTFVNVVLDLLIDGESGIWHLSGEDEISYYEIARMALSRAGLNEKVVFPVTSDKLKYAASRPVYSVLRSSSGIVLPSFGHILDNFLSELLNSSFLKFNEQSVLI